MILGDLPPYEAFPIGGTNSVRGYSEGGVGSGRNYVAGTAELHMPLIAPVEVSRIPAAHARQSWQLMRVCLAFVALMASTCGTQGTLFFDYGSDLDSGASVLGDPAGARGKPGSGFGYGAGIRVDSPVGPLRLEYAFNDKGLRRFHLGIGSHG